MRKYLLPQKGNIYKANLHAHSTVSDGHFTPEELKSLYKNKGYNILAYTDHELLVDHSDLNDDEFLAITSMEYAFIEKADYLTSRTIEFNFFAKDPHNVSQVCFNPENVFHGEVWRAECAKTVGDTFEREYTTESMQKVIDEAKANGFLVSLNHPSYSMESPEFFGKLNGLFAIEIYNHISMVGAGIFDYNPGMYDEMLRKGKRLYCIAADDCHGGLPDESPKCDRYGGFVMIKASELKYESIISALEAGDFYASMGPEIKELYIEDDFVHIECSPSKYIALNSNSRKFTDIEIAPEGEYITQATFKAATADAYMRFDIMDENGKHANTRAYWSE